MERGIVSMRVGFVLRSAEIQPLVPAICYCESGLDGLCALFLKKSRAARSKSETLSRSPPPPKQTQHTQPQPKRKLLPHPSIDGTFRKQNPRLFLRVSVVHLPTNQLARSFARAIFLRVAFIRPLSPTPPRPPRPPRPLLRSFPCGF